MRLSVAMEADAVGGEPLQIHDSWLHSLAGKSIERPKQHAIELAPMRILEQGRKLLAAIDAFAPTLLVNVLADYLVPSSGAPRT